MIEAAFVLHLFLQEPTLLQETRAKVRYYRRVKRKPQLDTGQYSTHIKKIEILRTYQEGAVFDQLWSYRICLHDAAWITDDTLQCSW